MNHTFCSIICIVFIVIFKSRIEKSAVKTIKYNCKINMHSTRQMLLCAINRNNMAIQCGSLKFPIVTTIVDNRRVSFAETFFNGGNQAIKYLI